MADRGMISETNIKAAAKMGWEYVVGAWPRNSNEIRDREADPAYPILTT